MLTAALLCVGVAAFIVAASACLAIARLLKVNALPTFDKPQACDGKTNWEEMKNAFFVFHMRCQAIEAVNRQKIVSWARTLLLCAGLCLTGIVIQVEFDESISIAHIGTYLKAPHPFGGSHLSAASDAPTH